MTQDKQLEIDIFKDLCEKVSKYVPDDGYVVTTSLNYKVVTYSSKTRIQYPIEIYITSTGSYIELRQIIPESESSSYYYTYNREKVFDFTRDNYQSRVNEAVEMLRAWIYEEYYEC